MANEVTVSPMRSDYADEPANAQMVSGDGRDDQVDGPGPHLLIVLQRRP
jgi:hypothetical protein